jgi:hypothetical protein
MRFQCCYGNTFTLEIRQPPLSDKLTVLSASSSVWSHNQFTIRKWACISAVFQHQCAPITRKPSTRCSWSLVWMPCHHGQTHLFTFLIPCNQL